jgi:hypothetical protein
MSRPSRTGSVVGGLLALAAAAVACGGGGGAWPTQTSDVERQFESLCQNGEVRVGSRGSQLAGASAAVCTCIVKDLRTHLSYADFKDATSASAGGVQLASGNEARAVQAAATRCQRRFPD